MKTQIKKQISIIVILTALLTLMPAGNVQAESKSPAKLSAKDFIFTVDGKKEDFMEISKNDPAYWYYNFVVTDTKNMKEGVKSFKTNRKVDMGSTESYIKKQYGKVSKKKINQKETLYKLIKYDNSQIDTSAWKSYLEYNYKQGNNQYAIRFYLNKKNRVTATIFLKNLKNFHKYPNKEVKCDISFKAPAGKKVTIKTINGKRVYMLPKNTKICFSKGKAKPSWKILAPYVTKYDKNGIPETPGESLYANYKQGAYYNLKKEMEKADIYGVNKSGKYLYYRLYIRPDDEHYSLVNKYAPYILYFKFV